MTLQLAQLLAYSMLTLSSVAVASVSLMFGYRQNFGWAPIGLVTSHGMTMAGFKGHYGFTLDLEVWNRRKYPIVVRGIEINTSVLEFVRDVEGWEYDRKWLISRPKDIIYTEQLALDPAGHASFSVEVPFARRSLDDLIDPLRVTIHYFDPRHAKLKSLHLRYKYHMGALDKPSRRLRS